jgi:hypothetical protein
VWRQSAVPVPGLRVIDPQLCEEEVEGGGEAASKVEVGGGGGGGGHKIG